MVLYIRKVIKQIKEINTHISTLINKWNLKRNHIFSRASEENKEIGTARFLGWLLIISLIHRRAFLLTPIELSRRMKKINKMNQQPAPWGARRVAEQKLAKRIFARRSRSISMARFCASRPDESNFALRHNT